MARTAALPCGVRGTQGVPMSHAACRMHVRMALRSSTRIAKPSASAVQMAAAGTIAAHLEPAGRVLPLQTVRVRVGDKADEPQHIRALAAAGRAAAGIRVHGCACTPGAHVRVGVGVGVDATQAQQPGLCAVAVARRATAVSRHRIRIGPRVGRAAPPRA